MHTASQLFSSDFDVLIEGEQVGVPGLFPGWHPHDRFGIVIDGPFHAIGANLLIQAAIAAHYDVRPRRRSTVPVYPEIVAFHVGGPHGDLSNYDFWPPRKEVVLPRSPSVLLTEINARGITRLAVPDIAAGDVTELGKGPNSWAETYAARDLIASAFAYSPSGTVADDDVVIAAMSDRLEQNLHSVLHLRDAVDAVLARGGKLARPDPDVPAEIVAAVAEDNQRWAATVRGRLPEVPEAERDRLIALREASLARHGGTPPETYRRLTIEEGLGVLAALV